MFNKKTVALFLVLAVAFSLALAGCGGQQATEEDTQQEQQAEQETTEETADKEEDKSEDKVKVTVAAGAVGQEKEMAKKQARMYEEEHPNVDVEILETPDLADNRKGLYLQFLEAQSSKVDVYQVDVIWPAELEEHFIDLNKHISQDVIDKHFDSIVENNTVNGSLVALPWFTDAGLLYYRTDLLEKYGYEKPPETWSELEKMAKKIQEGEREAGKQDFWGFVWQGDSYEGLTCDALEWIKSHGGGTIVSQDKKVTINNENAVEAIDKAAGWVGEISPGGVTGMAEEDARGVWQSGNAAFMRNWPYAYALGNNEDSAIKGKFDVAPLPAGPNGEPAHTLGGWNLAVSKYSENPEVAADVAQFLASPEQQKKRAIEITMNPTMPSLYEDEEILEEVPFFGKLYDVFVNAVPRPSAPTGADYSKVSKSFYTQVHAVLTGDKSAKEAVQYIEREVKNATGYETGSPQ